MEHLNPANTVLREATGDSALYQAYARSLLVSHDRYLLRKVASKVIHISGGRLEMFGGGYAQFVTRGKPTPDDERRLLLETRLALLSAALAAPGPEEKERLDLEFIAVSRELRRLKEPR